MFFFDENGIQGRFLGVSISLRQRFCFEGWSRAPLSYLVDFPLPALISKIWGEKQELDFSAFSPMTVTTEALMDHVLELGGHPSTALIGQGEGGWSHDNLGAASAPHQPSLSFSL